MLRVKKISLQNFKGIKQLTVFSFDDEKFKAHILSGPNGFGKTTLFDVIEICLTGVFRRVNVFDHVQNKQQGKNKPFFQNTEGEDVILRLWLEDTVKGKEYVIIKHYDIEHSPDRVDFGRPFIPADGHNILFTYLTDDPSFFHSPDFKTLPKVEQVKINDIIFGEGATTNLNSTYYLFNYIQQEDSIYFLRQSEDEKGAQLSFLFNIEREEEDKQKIVRVREEFNKQRSAIATEIDSLKSALPKFENANYKKLFGDKNYEFDSEKPFPNINTARVKLTEYEATLNSLISFRNEFNPMEFDKSVKYKKLNEQVLNDTYLLSAFTLKSIFKPALLGDVELLNAKIDTGTEFLKKPLTTLLEKKYFDLFIDDPLEWKNYSVVEGRINELNKDLGETGKIISELTSYRDLVLSEFLKLREIAHDHVSDKECPLCNSPFETTEKLLLAIASKGDTLKNFNSVKIAERALLFEQVKGFHSKISVEAQKFLSENPPVNKDVIALFRGMSNIQPRIELLLNEFQELNSDTINQFLLIAPPRNLEEINGASARLKDYLVKNVLPSYSYNEAKIQGKDLYQTYFDNSATFFNEVTTSMLNSKIQFLRSSYAALANDRLQFLTTREEKILHALSKINNVYERVHTTIKTHKHDMIEKIKIPFYIYSGRILQSYQQGMGIFIDIHPTNQKNNVQFKTGHESDHDIVYHLSSGQKAVVSLAFCLALNKVYNTNKNFRFLAIDDPIQTMDDLNVHTFIELVRNEFSDYQLIMSTHDDFTSRYMKYKFDKFGMTTKIQNVQKLVIEQSIS